LPDVSVTVVSECCADVFEEVDGPAFHLEHFEVAGYFAGDDA
jgi:hypothetical protein